MEVFLLAVGVCSTITTVATSPGPFIPSTSSSASSTSFRQTGLTTNRLQDLGRRGQWLLRHIAIMSHTCGVKEMPSLRRKLLRNSDIMCNDGSHAGYYIRRSHGSHRWIVFLEGGWYCFDRTSCLERSRVMPDYMSSKHWPRYRTGTGILSWDPEENPYYFHSNVVYVPYCSSDSWSGTKNRTSPLDFAFLGSRILEEVILELWRKGMRHAKTVILAGTSAGGTGVLINLDRVADLIHARGPQVDVRGLVDAGWFLDAEPFKVKPCRDAFTCSPMAGIQKGIEVWEPRLPKDCVNRYPKEIWRCYFGHRVYPYIKTPVYVVQNLYDAAQIKVSNVFEEHLENEPNSEQWRYLLRLGELAKDTLNNVSAVFAPACVSHEILTKPEWHTISIQGTALPESVYCWETSNGITSQCEHASFSTMLTGANETPLADAPPSEKPKRKKRKKGKRRRKKKNRKRKKNRRRKNNRGRNSRSVTKRCPHKLVDACPWPHCNCSCPKCRWHAMARVNKYFVKALGALMGIDQEKMDNIHLCGY